MTATAVKCFGFEDHLVRVILKGDDPWFVAVDVCRVLGIRDASEAVEKLDDDEKSPDSIRELGDDRGLWIVSESGLYTLILRCRSATTPGTPAHRFRKWVTAEVLPQIRRTGAYAPDIDGATGAAGTVAEDRLKLDHVHYALRCFGPAAARAVWKELGLVWVPEMEAAGREKPTADMQAARFCETRLERRPGVMTPAQTIYSAYRDWCSSQGEIAISDVSFGKVMTRLGFDKVKSSRIYYRGVVVKPQEAVSEA